MEAPPSMSNGGQPKFLGYNHLSLDFGLKRLWGKDMKSIPAGTALLGSKSVTPKYTKTFNGNGVPPKDPQVKTTPIPRGKGMGALVK